MGSRWLRLEYLLLFSVFVIATCGLVYELVAGALASYLLGDSVRQFSFVIGIYLFSMGVGSYLAKYLNNNLLDKFIDIEILVGLVGGFSSVILFWLFDYHTHFELVLYSLVFITGCLVGVELPLLMTLLQDRVAFKDLVSNVLSFDYVGALIASLLFPLVLVPKLGLLRTSLFFGLLNVGIALALIFLLKKEIKNAFGLRVRAWLAFSMLLTAFVFADRILSFSEEKLYNEDVIFHQSSAYQRIVLTRVRNELKLYLNNNLQFSSRDEYRYHEALVHPAMSLAPRVERVLVLGGGDGLAVREILKYDSVQEVVLVDLDGKMTDLFQHNEMLKSLNAQSLTNPKVKVINADAFIWLRENKTPFDVAIVDFPDPSNYSVGKLYTRNFYETLRAAIRPEGIVVVQSTSPFFAPRSFWCVERTMHTVFQEVRPYHIYVPSFGEWGFMLAAPETSIVHRAPLRRVDGLKFYDFELGKYDDFPADMQKNDVEINRLDNQILVRYFDEEWSKY
ncbi:MAG TPA: polyamine aminopropyltransferase [Saprospiraceae bacterium]|nr:polyamine aminopropyltransferase [Saprospiraceae bacterium]